MKESISATGGAASDALASARAHTPELPTTPLKSPALYLSKNLENSSKSLPLAATTTKLRITSNAASPTSVAANNETTSTHKRNRPKEQEIQNASLTTLDAEKSRDAVPEDASITHETRPESQNQASEVPRTVNESARWLNWFSRPEIATADEAGIMQPDDNATGANKDPLQCTVPDALQTAPDSSKQRRNSDPNPVFPNTTQQEVPRSWLSLWGNASRQTKGSSSASATGLASNPQNDTLDTERQAGKVVDVIHDNVSTPQPPQEPGDGSKSSYGWAFWSKNQPKSNDEKTSSGSDIGELALAGSSLQCKPKTATVDEAKGAPKKTGNRQRLQSLDADEDPHNTRGSRDDAKKDCKREAVPFAPDIKPKTDNNPNVKHIQENLLLPSFRGTYRTVGKPSLIQQISKLLQLSSTSEPSHVAIVQNPPRVKRALAIVSLAQCNRHGLIHIADFSSEGCSWLFSGTLDSFRLGSTNRHICSFCQLCSQRYSKMDTKSGVFV